MNVVRQKLTIMVLIAVLFLSAAGNGTALTVSCASKLCCCPAATPMDLHHHGNGLIRLAHKYAPMTSAPCCQFKPVQLKTELAISRSLKISVNRAVTTLRPSNGFLPVAQHFATKTPIIENERIRAPLVPIYLLTLTILC